MFTVVKDHVDILCIVEITVKCDNIWVVESPLNFELALHLTKEIKFLQHVLEDYLKSTWHP